MYAVSRLEIVYINFLIDGKNYKLNNCAIKFDRLTTRNLSYKEYILIVHERFLINNKNKDLPYYVGTDVDPITLQRKPRLYFKSGRILK